MPSNNKLITAIVVSTFFGLSGGLVGAMITRSYLLEKTFNIPMVGEIDFLENNGTPNIVIRGAGKVVVEQSAKVSETVTAANKSLVGIFKKIKSVKPTARGTSTEAFNPENFYQLEKNLGQGLIITSDGWIISDFIPDKILNAVPGTDAVYAGLKKETLGEYVIILKDGTVYAAEDIALDRATGYSFWRIKANDLPVTGFARRGDITNGKQVVAVNWDNWTWVTTIVGQPDTAPLVRSSDTFSGEIVLAEKFGDEFAGSFLFDLNGNLEALINKEGRIKPIYYFTTGISYLLKNKEVKHASLGLNYIDLSVLAGDKNAAKGALIYKDINGVALDPAGAAYRAGLRAGDIITAVDGTELSRDVDLAAIMTDYAPGDELSLDFLRGAEKLSVKVKLGELK